MKLYELIENVEMQSEYKTVYYDYVKEERFQVNTDDYADRDVLYIYVDDDIIYIEIDNEEEIAQ